MRITDAHFHFWNPHMSAYHRVPATTVLGSGEYAPAVLKPFLDGRGVSDAVLVQVYNDYAGTDEFLSHAFHYDWIGAVVGWVDLDGPDLGYRLDHYQRTAPKFAGARHLWQDEPDADHMLRPEMVAGCKELARRGLRYDICVKPWNWPYMDRFVEQLTDLPMVIDHIAKPDVAKRQFDDWAALMERMAAHPNVVVKLSGLVTEATPHAWQPADFQPYVDHLLRVFGPDRLMYGSDWPVCLLAADSYGQTFDLLRTLIGDLSEADQAKILGETCRRFYGIR